MLKEKYQTEIDDILSRYPVKRSALIPLLYLAQRDEGFISEAAMKEIAGLLRLTPPQVYETATFYTMLNLKRVGKFHLQVCKSLMCALAGSDTVECLAACGTAPMMQVNEDYYERLTEQTFDRILADLKENGTCSLKTGPFMWPEAPKAQ
jgi:NADH-quinone oxidoreductase subunit E